MASINLGEGTISAPVIGVMIFICSFILRSHHQISSFLKSIIWNLCRSCSWILRTSTLLCFCCLAWLFLGLFIADSDESYILHPIGEQIRIPFSDYRIKIRMPCLYPIWIRYQLLVRQDVLWSHFLLSLYLQDLTTCILIWYTKKADCIRISSEFCLMILFAIKLIVNESVHHLNVVDKSCYS